MKNKIILVLALLMLIQQSGLAQKDLKNVPLPKGAKLVFKDDFNHGKLKTFARGYINDKKRKKLDWCICKGEWEIVKDKNNGYLFGKGKPGKIILDKVLTPNFRLEYLTWSKNPGDRSAFLCIPLPNFAFKDIYYFHFAGGYSKYNIITRLGNSITPQNTQYIPKPGQKCRMVVQKIDDLLEMYIDGKNVFRVKDKDYQAIKSQLYNPQGVFTGFFTYSKGVCFDDLKVFSLPGEAVEKIQKEATPTYTYWRGFGSDKAGSHPREAQVHAAQGCKVKVINEPTPVYYPRPEGQVMVKDHAVELIDNNANPDANASIVFPLKDINNGEIEVELMALSYSGKCAELALLDQKGRKIAGVIIDKDGYFWAETADGLKKLNDKISYKNRPPGGRFYFQKKRWFTIRLSFNVYSRLFHVSIVNLYSGCQTKGIQYYPLGGNLKTLRKLAVCAVKVSTLGKSHLLIDNVCAISPRAITINNKLATSNPIREILELSYPLRKDPAGLFVYTLRNQYPNRHPFNLEMKNRYRRAPTEVFTKAANYYGKLLVQSGYLEERQQTLARMIYLLRNSLTNTEIQSKKTQFDIQMNEVLAMLQKLLNIYAYSYMDSLNEKTLTESFYSLADNTKNKLTSLEKQADDLANSLITIAGKGLPPVPGLAPGPYDAPIEWKNKRYERDGKPAFFYPPYGCRATDLINREHQDKLLQLDNCYDVPRVMDQCEKKNRKDTQSYTWELVDTYIMNWIMKDNPAVSFGVRPWMGTVYLMQEAPAWWFEANKDDKDIYFRDRKGNLACWPGTLKHYIKKKLSGGRYTGGGGYKVILNYWNDKVKKMYNQTIEEWAKYMSEKYPGKMKFFLAGWEGCQSFRGKETGFNISAIAAFRKELQAKYKTIDALNKTWESSYKSFNDIDPHDYTSEKPNGLMYEFQSFRQKGYFDWMRLVKESAQKYLPGMAFTNDFHNAGDFPVSGGILVPEMFKCFDMVGWHSYNVEYGQQLYRVTDSLRKAYGNTLGNFEWAAGLGCRDLFNEKAYKASGLTDLFSDMAWGKAVTNIWYGGGTGFSEGAQYWIPSLGNNILRYSTTYIPIARLRSRRFGEIALTCPTVTPKLAIFNSSSSFLNGIRNRVKLKEIGQMVINKGWNFGFIFEIPLDEGKQKLAGIKTIVIPLGVCLKPAISDKLLNWIKEGGTLISILPPGVYNQFGQKDDRIIKTVMGNIEYELNAKYDKMKILKLDKNSNVSETQIKDNGSFIKAKYGKGKLIILTNASPVPEDVLMNLVSEATPRDYFVKNQSFRVVVRESDRYLYAFVVNPDYYDVKEDIVVTNGSYKTVVDLGTEKFAFPVPIDSNKDSTSFKLRLAPGEGTVIRLEK